MADKTPSLKPIDTLIAVADFINRVYVDKAIRDLGPNIATALDRLQKRVAATINHEMTPAAGCEACYFTGHAHGTLNPCPVCCSPSADLEPHNVD
jgi:hypothetical protein